MGTDTKLENDLLSININTAGAELTSIIGKKDNTEYIWQADPKYWKRYTPVLFPIVGRVRNDVYRVEGKEYHLNQHGFARDSEFELVIKEGKQLVYKLEDSEESMKVYPFKFKFYIIYTLVDNKVVIKYSVKNTDDRDIYFSIGSHPGFACPLVKGESFEDYYLEFEKKEIAQREYLDREERLYTGKKEVFLDNSRIIDLKKDLFTQDALVFKKLKSKKVSLKSRKSSKTVTIDFKEFPYLGIWSRANDAPFICIEPWQGRADFYDFDGDFSEKDGIVKLGREESFLCSYTIIIDQ